MEKYLISIVYFANNSGVGFYKDKRLILFFTEKNEKYKKVKNAFKNSRKYKVNTQKGVEL
jgi:hypothetical protein